MSAFLLRVVGVLSGVGFIAVILLPSAGRLDLTRIWVYLAVTALMAAVGIARMDPGLIRERFKPGPGAWDRPVELLLGPGYPAHLVVAGLDIGRFHWSAAMPTLLVVLGFVAYAVGNAFCLWSMIVNPYFSPKIRLQSDRGQTVVSNGPYAYLRHPGYAGAAVMLVGSAFALGSWASLIPSIIAVVGLVWRTSWEDRFLKANLPGYAGYAARVPYRLIPRIW